MKITPIDEIEDLADGVPVLAVQGTVKYAQEVKRGKSAVGHDWTKQFFVLSSGTAEIACSMWDAEGSELAKGEKVHIENTQNKKGVWAGMTKGSYQKDGERKHTLEIRANQVKITEPNGKSEPTGPKPEPEFADPHGHPDPDWPDAPANSPQSPPTHPLSDAGVTEARKHLMQSANLYNLCVSAVDKAIAPNMPEIAQTSEQFQAAVGTLFIEASRAGFVTKMPQSPIK